MKKHKRHRERHIEHDNPELTNSQIRRAFMRIGELVYRGCSKLQINSVLFGESDSETSAADSRAAQDRPATITIDQAM